MGRAGAYGCFIGPSVPLSQHAPLFRSRGAGVRLFARHNSSCTAEFWLSLSSLLTLHFDSTSISTSHVFPPPQAPVVLCGSVGGRPTHARYRPDACELSPDRENRLPNPQGQERSRSAGHTMRYPTSLLRWPLFHGGGTFPPGRLVHLRSPRPASGAHGVPPLCAARSGLPRGARSHPGRRAGSKPPAGPLLRGSMAPANPQRSPHSPRNSPQLIGLIQG